LIYGTGCGYREGEETYEEVEKRKKGEVSLKATTYDESSARDAG
jgi:hypothetical protein